MAKNKVIANLFFTAVEGYSDQTVWPMAADFTLRADDYEKSKAEIIAKSASVLVNGGFRPETKREIPIVNGWKAKRFTFWLQLDRQSYEHSAESTIITGYTDHSEHIVKSGLQTEFDPAMVLYPQRIITVRKTNGMVGTTPTVFTTVMGDDLILVKPEEGGFTTSPFDVVQRLVGQRIFEQTFAGGEVASHHNVIGQFNRKVRLAPARFESPYDVMEAIAHLNPEPCFQPEIMDFSESREDSLAEQAHMKLLGYHNFTSGPLADLMINTRFPDTGAFTLAEVAVLFEPFINPIRNMGGELIEFATTGPHKESAKYLAQRLAMTVVGCLPSVGLGYACVVRDSYAGFSENTPCIHSASSLLPGSMDNPGAILDFDNRLKVAISAILKPWAGFSIGFVMSASADGDSIITMTIEGQQYSPMRIPTFAPGLLSGQVVKEEEWMHRYMLSAGDLINQVGNR